MTQANLEIAFAQARTAGSTTRTVSVPVVFAH